MSGVEEETPRASPGGIVQASEPGHNLTDAPVRPGCGKDLVVFEPSLNVGEFSKGDRLDGEGPPQNAFSVNTTVRSNFFVGNGDPIGPSTVNVIDELNV